MRIAAAILLCRCLIAQTPASVSGTVIDAITNQPLAGVDVSFFSITDAGHTVPGFEPTIYGSLSKADGTFSISGLPPSTYMVNPKRNGYWAVHPETLSVILKSGENKTDLRIAMTRSAAIVGHVTDQHGDPVQLVRVSAVSATPGSEPLLALGTFTAATDDHGEFLLICRPGKYLVSATPEHTDRSQPDVYSTTWYPGADSGERATVIEALPGRETNGIEIRLVSHVSLSVSGIVSGALAGTPEIEARLWSPTAGSQFEVVRSMRVTRVGKDGRFTLAGLTAGDYQIEAEANGTPAMRSAVVDLHLISDQRGVQLVLRAGEELNGVLDIPGGLGSARPQIDLWPVSPIGMATGQGAHAAVTTAEGVFHLNPVFPGQYSVSVKPMPPGAYIRSVRLDDTEIGAEVVDLTRSAGSAQLRIALSPNGATLTGSVVDEKGEPSEQAVSVVVLARSGDDAHVHGSGSIARGTNFTIQGIGPGKYRLFAADPRVMNLNLKALFEKGEPIEIHEGERITKNAKLVALP